MRVEIEVGLPGPGVRRLDAGEMNLQDARALQRELRPVVVAEVPVGPHGPNPGRLQRELAPRLSRRGEAAVIAIGPRAGRRHDPYADVAAVARFVTRGTANRGTGRIFPKRAKKLRLPWGFYRSVRGQQPNDFMSRIAAAAALRIPGIVREGQRARARAQPRWAKGEVPWAPTGPGPGRFRKL